MTFASRVLRVDDPHLKAGRKTHQNSESERHLDGQGSEFMSPILADERPPLLPARSSSINSRYKVGSGSEPTKRKRSDTAENGNRETVFSARLLPDHGSIVSFSPITTLLRAHLSLSWLHPNPDQNEVCGGSLLEATVTSVSRWEYQVLIARRIPNGLLYALEKLENEIYVCYPLQNFVTEYWVQQAVVGAAPPVELSQVLDGRQETLARKETKHARKISSPLEVTSSAPKNRRGAAARMSILSPSDIPSANTTTVADVPVIDDSERTNSDEVKETVDKTPSHLPSDTALTTHTSDDQIIPMYTTGETNHETSKPERLAPDLLAPEYLRQRYLDTLYLSKTSLAYYTKGPLSRARARARGVDSTMSLEQLAAYYRGSIISPKKMDLKYKDSLPELVKSLTFQSHVPDAESSKKKKTKRTKLGKDGLWPMETDFVTRWWHSQTSQSSGQPADAEASLRDSLSQLRMRETELQIILILETLSLESKSETIFGPKSVPADPDIKVESIEEDLPTTKVKANKQGRDLSKDLDMLVDKLCIWHSVGLEAAAVPAEKGQGQNQSTSDTKDRLRSFCADVVIPFYSSKIPEICKSLCHSLGGPTTSPQRPRSFQPKHDPLPTLPPGTIIKDRNPLLNKRTLERVLSEEGLRQTSPPTLSRSNTVPSGPAFKREQSEVSQRPMSRSGMHKSASFSNREIDLVADAKATAAKRRKLDMVANQKRDLQAAIDALKKPNRSGAARTYMDDAESRMLLQPRKVEHGVQISATPKPKRQTTLDTDEYDLPPMPTFANGQVNAVVPSSTVKPQGLGALGSVPRSSGKKRAVLMAIHDTPSRGSAKITDALLLDSRTSGPAPRFDRGVRNANLIMATPAKSLQANLATDFDTSPLRMNKSRPVQFQAVRKTDVIIEQAFRDAPEIPEAAGKMMERAMRANDGHTEMSIYESLGWDDDYEL